MKRSCIGLLIAVVCAGCAHGADSRPNILFCLADDWSYPHAGVYGDPVIQTPGFDRIAREGALFTYCYSATPSCTASRASILTGQAPHRLERGANLWGSLPNKFKVYPDILEQAGYVVGETSKGWGPGDFKAGGWTRNPAGPRFKNFEEFYKTVPHDRPFCFWLGSTDPHRPYKTGNRLRTGLNPDKVVVPPIWPDNAQVRSDILDYYAAAERFDGEVVKALKVLQDAGQLDNTLIVMTGDNGWPFPRCKANLYDGGTRQPLAVRWPAKVKAGRTIEDFVNLADLAPTFLEAAGMKPLLEMTGRSILRVLTGDEPDGSRSIVYLERERHAYVRAEQLGYPIRAVRTRQYLYVWNLRPDRWPAGDPQSPVDPSRVYGDVDNGGTKSFILAHKDDPQYRIYYELAFAKRPPEELYDVQRDPYSLHNLANDAAYSQTKAKLRASLEEWMKETRDPRLLDPASDSFDHYRFEGREAGRKEAGGGD